jgi:hypothetical protein
MRGKRKEKNLWAEGGSHDCRKHRLNFWKKFFLKL